MSSSAVADVLRKASRRDWALLVIAIWFTLSGLLILPVKPATGIAALLLFGPGVLIFASRISHKLRHRGPVLAKVEIMSGAPIRAPRFRLFAGGLVVLLLGLLFVAIGEPQDLMPFWLGIGLVAPSALMLAGVALGWWPSGYLEFCEEGFWVGGRRLAYFVPWDAVSDIRPARIHGTSLLVVSLNAIAAARPRSPEMQKQLFKQIGWNLGWAQGHVVITPQHYRLDAFLLVHAMQRYVADAGARRELGRVYLAWPPLIAHYDRY